MAADFQQITKNLSDTSANLVNRVMDIIAQRDDALRKVADHEATIKEQASTIARLQQQIEYLTVVTTALPAPGDIDKSRAILSGLVREIDKCINDLTE